MFLVLRSKLKGLISFSSVNDFHFRNVVPILLSFPCNTLLVYVHRIQWEIQLIATIETDLNSPVISAFCDSADEELILSHGRHINFAVFFGKLLDLLRTLASFSRTRLLLAKTELSLSHFSHLTTYELDIRLTVASLHCTRSR